LKGPLKICGLFSEAEQLTTSGIQAHTGRKKSLPSFDSFLAGPAAALLFAQVQNGSALVVIRPTRIASFGWLVAGGGWLERKTLLVGWLTGGWADLA